MPWRKIDTRSGELLSGLIGTALATCALLMPTSFIRVLLLKADAFPQWAILSIVCSIFCVWAVFSSSPKVQTFSRFLSGCVFGSIALLLTNVSYFGAFFWVSIILLTFDLAVVIQKGTINWTQKNHSSTPDS